MAAVRSTSNVRSYRDLVVWQKAMSLAEVVYATTVVFPKTEMYGLTSQMRRAAVSVASNIAEGQARTSRGVFIQFLGHARGSLAELETQTILAVRLQFITPATEKELVAAIGTVGRLLSGLRNSLKPRNESKLSYCQKLWTGDFRRRLGV